MSLPCVIWDSDPLHSAYLKQLYEEGGFSVTVWKGYQAFRDAVRVHTAYPVLLVMSLYDQQLLKYIPSLQQLAPFSAILVLSSVQTSEASSMAFDAGADAYQTQPFVPDELLQKSRALLLFAQRLLKHSQLHREVPATTFGPMVFHHGTKEVQVEENIIPLSQREFLLLRYLGQHAGQELTREEICQALWSDAAIAKTRRLDNVVLQLRKKLANVQDVSIQTLYGRGYICRLSS